MRSAEPDETSTGLRVPIRRHHRAPVGKSQKSVAADGDRRRFGFEFWKIARRFRARSANLMRKPIGEKGSGPQARFEVVAFAGTLPMVRHALPMRYSVE